MADRELRKMNRAQLLKLLLAQTIEAENLRDELAKAQKQLADRQLQLDKAGDLAHAVLEINGVMEAAQAAAAQYLENIAAMEAETKKKCQQMIEEARQEAARIRENAET